MILIHSLFLLYHFISCSMQFTTVVTLGNGMRYHGSKAKTEQQACESAAGNALMSNSNSMVGQYSVYRTRHVNLVVISGTTKLVLYRLVKSLQLIWRSGTRRWNLRVPNLQMSCSNMIRMRWCQDSVS